MTPKDNVHRLICALSSHERQVFSKAAKGPKAEEPKYLKLFKTLCEVEQYDEKSFLESRRGKPFAKGFAVQKSELYDRVLHVLRSQRQSSGAEKPLEFQIREKVEEARLLWEKKLYDLSKDRLRQARLEAEKYEFHEILIEILRMQRSVVIAEQEQGFVEAVRILHEEIAEIGRVILNKYKMLGLKDQLFLPARQHATLAYKVDMVEIDLVMATDELNNVGLCLSFEAELAYHFCHAIYQHLQENAEQAWIHGRAIYLMWQEHKGVQRVRPLDYRNMLQNYLSLCNDAMRDEDFDIALAQLDMGPFHSQEEEISAKTNSLNVRLQRYLNFCDWDAAKGVLHEYRNSLDAMAERMNPSRMMTFYLSFSRLCMVTGDYDCSLSWARKVIGEGGHDAEEGLVLQARVQELIALMEKKDWDKLEKSRKLTAKLIGNGTHQAFEQAFIRWLAGQSKVVEAKEKIGQLKKLLALLDVPAHRKHSADRMVHLWLRSKIEGERMTTILERERDAALAERSGAQLQSGLD